MARTVSPHWTGRSQEIPRPAAASASRGCAATVMNGARLPAERRLQLRAEVLALGGVRDVRIEAERGQVLLADLGGELAQVDLRLVRDVLAVRRQPAVRECELPFRGEDVVHQQLRRVWRLRLLGDAHAPGDDRGAVRD